MKSSQELYAFVDRLIEELQQIGKEDDAEKLRLAMRISSVSTEVFMCLRFELTELFDKNLALAPETMSKIKEAIDDINFLLR